MSTSKNVYAPDFIRLKVRRLDEETILKGALESAKEKGRVVIQCHDGGSVCNKYAYKADTEGCVTVAWPDGSVYQDMCRLPANKVTQSGVFARITGFRGLFDSRFSDAKKKAIRTQFLLSIQSANRC